MFVGVLLNSVFWFFRFFSHLIDCSKFVASAQGRNSFMVVGLFLGLLFLKNDAGTVTVFRTKTCSSRTSKTKRQFIFISEREKKKLRHSFIKKLGSETKKVSSSEFVCQLRLRNVSSRRSFERARSSAARVPRPARAGEAGRKRAGEREIATQRAVRNFSLPLITKIWTEISIKKC